MQEALKYFTEIDDPRSARNQKHPLNMLIGTILLASHFGNADGNDNVHVRGGLFSCVDPDHNSFFLSYIISLLFVLNFVSIVRKKPQPQLQITSLNKHYGECKQLLNKALFGEKHHLSNDFEQVLKL